MHLFVWTWGRGSGYTDAVPLKERDAKAVLDAYKKITSRKPLKGCPHYILQTDNGSEFHGVFATYIKKKGILQRYGKVGRSRQQAFVEELNKVIGQALFTRMSVIGQGILTDVEDTQWTNHLKCVIKYYNLFQREDNTHNKKNVVIAPYVPKGTCYATFYRAT
jgi:hypothetical protein